MKEYQLYKKFLDSLTPPEWREAQRAERNKKRVEKASTERVTSASRKKGKITCLASYTEQILILHNQ